MVIVFIITTAIAIDSFKGSKTSVFKVKVVLVLYRKNKNNR